MTTALLICNPAAGRGRTSRHLPEIRHTFQSLGVTTEVWQTRAALEATDIAQQAAHDGFGMVIAVGGDGTLNEVANGLVQATAQGAISTLGIIPLGTGNDFIKSLGVFSDWRAACAQIAQGQTRQIDVGRINERIFINTAGIGFDAQVGIEAQKIKWLRGQSVYVAALARNMLLSYQTPKVTIQCDDLELEQSITLVTIGNGRCSGGGFWLTPNAEIDDGLLDVCIVHALSKAKILALVPRVMKGAHIEHEAVRMVRTRRLVVTSEVPLPVHVDGEILHTDCHQIEVEILPSRLTMVT